MQHRAPTERSVSTNDQTTVMKERGNLPRHIAIIMDGNGRWAKGNGFRRVTGHRHGVESVRVAVRACAELGVEVLSLYVFSTENWNRPRTEVVALMRLLRQTLLKETDELNQNNVRLRVSGRISELPEESREAIAGAIEKTSANTGLTLNLCINYSGRAELVDAVQAIVANATTPEDVTEALISKHMYTHDLPDPDLVIRTSGEMRVSNYLLWQSAYAEFTFPQVLWPDFRREHLFEAITDYQKRQRRFGKTGDQLYVESKQDSAE
jgi:undecaprenyl diphosphate synthase